MFAIRALGLILWLSCVVKGENLFKKQHKEMKENQLLYENWFRFENKTSAFFYPLFNFTNSSLFPTSNQHEFSSISSKCRQSILNFFTSFARLEHWAVQMIDASAKFPPNGILEGTLTDFGQYDECLSVRLKETEQELLGQYCTLRIKPKLPKRRLFSTIYDKYKKSEKQNTSKLFTHLFEHVHYFHFISIRLGICTPSSCSANELNLIMKTLFNHTFNLEARIDEEDCETIETIKKSQQFTFNQYVASFILTCFAFFSLVGTLNDFFNIEQNQQTMMRIINKALKRVTFALDATKDEGKLRKLFICLECFSMKRNLRSLLDLNETTSKDKIKILHGIRTFAMAWIILGHTYGLINPEKLSESFLAVNLYSTWFTQPLLNATLSVSTFFVISGILTSYTLSIVLLQPTSLNQTNRNNIYDTLVHPILFRLYRLLPPYIGLLCMTLLLPHFRFGPLWTETIEKPVVSKCELSVWPNLLFLNNFFNTQNMCLIHTWFLSNDFQFHLIGIFLFNLLLRKRNLAFIAMILIAFACVIYSMMVTQLNNYPPTILSIAPAVTERWNYILDFYYKPWCHLPSYLIGFFFGYSLFCAKNGRKEKTFLFYLYENKSYRRLMYLINSMIMLITLFSIYPWNAGIFIPQWITSLYAAFFRHFWSFANAWFIYGLTLDNSGILFEILSWPGFTPISRLTYASYLIHPLIILINFSSSNLISSNGMEFFNIFIVNFVLSNFAAVFLSLLFEAPLCCIQRKIKQNKNEIFSNQKLYKNKLCKLNELHTNSIEQI